MIAVSAFLSHSLFLLSSVDVTLDKTDLLSYKHALYLPSAFCGRLFLGSRICRIDYHCQRHCHCLCCWHCHCRFDGTVTVVVTGTVACTVAGAIAGTVDGTIAGILYGIAAGTC